MGYRESFWVFHGRAIWEGDRFENSTIQTTAICWNNCHLVWTCIEKIDFKSCPLHFGIGTNFTALVKRCPNWMTFDSTDILNVTHFCTRCLLRLKSSKWDDLWQFHSQCILLYLGWRTNGYCMQKSSVQKISASCSPKNEFVMKLNLVE